MENNRNRVTKPVFLRKSIHNSTNFQRTRRSWLPNIFHHVYTSEVLQRNLRVSITSKTLKCVRKYGTFDNYVLMCPPK